MLRIAKEIYRFLRHILQSRELLATLIKNDFKKQYLGSYLGLAWAFIQPLIFILVIWAVFTFGLRAGPVGSETPFFLYLISGMIPWFFISNTLNSGTGAVVNNAFLVKKVAFRVSILPLVEIGSALLIHLVLAVFLLLAFVLHGFSPSLYWLQLPYYMGCAVAMLLGLSWLTSAVRVFVKDIGNLISVLIQVGFWATPIFWQIGLVPEKYQWIIKLNPAYYIINGYRDSLINQQWFWQDMSLTLYFLGLCLFSLGFGALLFKRLRPHFGDVL